MSCSFWIILAVFGWASAASEVCRSVARSGYLIYLVLPIELVKKSAGDLYI
jgi:hypothetical protein